MSFSQLSGVRVALFLVLLLASCTGNLTNYDATLEDSTDAVSKYDGSTNDSDKSDSADDNLLSKDTDIDGPTGACRDLDRDDHQAEECGGDDCDDSNRLVHPGAAEVCDSRGVDEDCDPCTVTGMGVTPGDDGAVARREGDDDSDEYISAGCFNRYEGRTPTGCSSSVQIDGAMRRVTGRDCDDTNANTHPEQTEVCNGRDDNCNGETDEGVQRTYFIDRDGDGYGDRGSSELARRACARPVGFSETADDCDDAAASVNPAAREICDMASPPVDENCNGTRNEGCDCSDGADRACMQSGVCAAGRQRCVAGRWGNCSISPSAEVCNGVDDNCDGAVDNTPPGSCRPTGAECRDGRCQCPSGLAECGGVCRALGGGCDNGQVGICRRSGSILCEGGGTRCNAPSGSPGVEECNGLDDNCDGRTDELSGSFCPRRSCVVCGMAGNYGTCANCAYSNCTASPFSRMFYGNDAALRHSCGNTGAAPPSWGCGPISGVVVAQYGPYLSLPPGRYRVEFFLTGAAAVDVSINNGMQILASSTTQMVGGYISLEFSIASGCPEAEFRVHAGFPSRYGTSVLINRTVLTRF